MSDHSMFSFKVVTNKQNTKVLYAEADIDFTDVLLSFLTLPLGKIVRVLEDQYGDEAPVIGSLTTLYESLVNLDIDHFWTEGGKQMLLDPISSSGDECRKLKFDINGTQSIKYFACENWTCRNHRLGADIGMYYATAICCICGKQLKREIPVRTNASQAVDGDDGGVFTVSGATFVISDDLQIFPNVAASNAQILANLGIIAEVEGVVERNVSLGFDEIKHLLKWSLISRTPLTNLILKREHIISSAFATPMGMSLPLIEKVWNSNSRAMSLKVFVRKDTNKVLYAEADEFFVDFLFSLLTVPLGGVEWLLGGITVFENIDNLYRSVANMNGDKFLKQNAKTMLLRPQLPFCYASENQILPLFEKQAPFLFFFQGNVFSNEYLAPLDPRGGCEQVSYNDCGGLAFPNFKSPKGFKGGYVKGPRMFMVTDDLTVAPLCTDSAISIFEVLKIPKCDIQELELHVGLEEALRILQASLVTSTSALTNGLMIYLMLKRQQDIEDDRVAENALVAAASKESKEESADIQELELHVGLKEASSILQVSHVTSTFALTNSPAIDSMLKRQRDIEDDRVAENALAAAAASKKMKEDFDEEESDDEEWEPESDDEESETESESESDDDEYDDDEESDD